MRLGRRRSVDPARAGARRRTADSSDECLGARARAVMVELHGEKIDIVDWSEDPARFLAEAWHGEPFSERR